MEIIIIDMHDINSEDLVLSDLSPKEFRKLAELVESSDRFDWR